MSKVVYAVEPFSDALIVEILPLLRDHYNELIDDPDIPLSPDLSRYYAMAGANLIHIVTARSEGELVGYTVNLLMRGLHYSTKIFATNDLVFVRKDFRKGVVGIRLLKVMEEELKKLGVHYICMHVKPFPDFGPVLKRMGYGVWETIWKKQIN